MTSYFDAIGSRLHEIQQALPAEDTYSEPLYKELTDIEVKLVDEIFLVTTLPGFPADLKEAAIQIALKWGNFSLPTYVQPSEEALRYIDVDTAGVIHCLGYLAGEFHTLFHELAHRNLEGFCDKPDSCLRSQTNPIWDRYYDEAKTKGRYVTPPGYGEDLEAFRSEQEAAMYVSGHPVMPGEDPMAVLAEARGETSPFKS